MEILDLYDKNGNLLNKTVERGCKNLGDNEFIKVVTVWLECKGKYLIQKTAKEKGGEYAVTGGHVQSGKNSLQQACLELQEELGLTVTAKQLKFLGNVYANHVIFDVYWFSNNQLDKTNFVLQIEEVAAVVWFDSDEIKQLISQGKVRPSTITQFEQLIQK